jgi:hypothetical protein
MKKKHEKHTQLQQGVRFDPDMPQTIRLEFAKSNTKGKTMVKSHRNFPLKYQVAGRIKELRFKV